jgi:hypothetical protein
MRHVLLLGTGCAPDAAKEEDDLAIELIKRGPVEILGEKVDINIIPNACEDFHDPSRVSIALLVCCE